MNIKNKSLSYSKQKHRFSLKKLKKNLYSENAKDVYTFISIIGLQETSFIKRIHDIGGATDVSRWMDNGSDIHGPYHRLYYGHDFLANIRPFVKKFGIKKIPEFIWELIKDFSSPKGLPLPGMQYLAKSSIDRRALDKFSTLNIGSAGAGFIALYDSYRYIKKYNKGFRKKDLVKGFIRIGKIPYGVWRGNPLLIISGAIDSVTLVQWFFTTGKQIKMEQNYINQQYAACFNQCNKIQNKISNLKIEWKNDIKEQEKTDKMVKEALADDEDNNKLVLKIIKGGK